MKFDQDLCMNLQSDFGKMNSTLGPVVPLAMFALDTDIVQWTHTKRVRDSFDTYISCRQAKREDSEGGRGLGAGGRDQ